MVEETDAERVVGEELLGVPVDILVSDEGIAEGCIDVGGYSSKLSITSLVGHLVCVVSQIEHGLLEVYEGMRKETVHTGRGSVDGFLLYVIDIRQKKSWTTFFHVFGVNALALYVSSELLAILLGNIGFSEMVYNGIHAVIDPLKWASLAYAIYFVLLNFAIGYILYRKKIYIKL